MLKKVLFATVLASLAVLTACTTGFTVPADLFDTNEDVISFQALTAASLLPTTGEQPLSVEAQNQLLSFTILEGEDEPLNEDPVGEAPEVEEEEEDPVIDNIEPYIELVEQFLGSDNGLTVQVGLSDIEGYELKMTFETRGILGEIQTYEIHYNMTLTEEEDDESEFAMEGLMIIDGQNYTLTGERKVEEGEEKIEFIAMLDELNYVESEYKIESDKTEFEVEVVVNGETVSETSVEIKYEDGETKIELEFEQGDNEGTYEFKYEEEDGVPILKIEYYVSIDGVEDEGEIVVSIHVDEVTGETYYQIFVEPDDGEGYERSKRRDIDHDDEDESSSDDSEEDEVEETEDDDLGDDAPVETEEDQTSQTE